MKKTFKMRVGTAIYTVRQLPELHFEGRRVYGLTHLKDKDILVEEKLQPMLKIHTLLHEFFHAGLHEHGNIDLDPEQEEQVVEALSHAFVMSWLQSKAFREAIQEIK